MRGEMVLAREEEEEKEEIAKGDGEVSEERFRRSKLHAGDVM